MLRPRRPHSFRNASLILGVFTCTLGICPALQADTPELTRALSWIPEDSVSFVIVPDLKKASNDVTQLIEATGQGGVLAMGRPIDMLKAQFGMGANLDEASSFVAYYAPASPAAAAADPAGASDLPVIVVPVTDADGFLAANLKALPEKGDGAYQTSDGRVVYAAKLEGRVVLASSRQALPGAEFRGIGERFHARLKGDQAAWLDRADLIAWASRDALHTMVERARTADIAAIAEMSEQAGAFVDPAMRTRTLDIADMLADGLIVLDADPLGLFIAMLGVAEPSTPLASVAAGGEGAAAKFDRLPQHDFYLALAASVDGLGGAAKLGEMFDLLGVPRTVLPPWVLTDGADLTTVSFAAYPSKLAVAIGGMLNDSAIFIGSRAPALTLARLQAGIESLAGERAGLRMEPLWTAEKTLKTGAIASAFEVKETVIDFKQRPAIDFERLAKQFMFGSRGVMGLASKTADGVVMAFSQRPDVYDRAREAAAGKSTLALDPTVTSLEEWLPASRDVELMIGVGPLVRLAAQIAVSFVSEEQIKAVMPKVDAGAEPIAIAFDVDGGRAQAVIVIPALVLKIAAQSGMAQAAKAAAAPDAAATAPPADGATP